MKKTYKRPIFTITDIETEDIITVSVFDSLITANEVLGYGTIKFSQIEVDFE